MGARLKGSPGGGREDLVSSRMATPIFTHLEGSLAISRHEHVAVLYRNQSAAYRLVPFVAEGLRKGDLCQVIAAGAFQFETLKQLGTQLKDLDRHLEVGTLRLHQGPEDLRELRRLCKQLFADAEGAHSHGVRWLEDTGWLKTGKLPMPDFFEFHATMNYRVKHYPSVALCQFALDRIETQDLFAAITVHRHLLIGDTLVRDNPFYMPPEKYLPLPPQERENDLAQLFREVGFDVDKLLAAIVGYGKL